MLRGLSYYLPVSRSDAKVHDQFDVTLEDADLLGEVELTTNLIIAATEADEHLSEEQIDAILGVVHQPDETD
jgi:hypothetical protein